MNPKLKENIWRIDSKNETATLIACGNAFEIPYHAALIFLKARRLCTGHNSINKIAHEIGIPEQSLGELFNSLSPSGIFISPTEPIDFSLENKRLSVNRIVNAWGSELAASYIGNELARGELSRNELVGWLLEMYHYIKDFPQAIHSACEHAPHLLSVIYEKYCKEETGHETFVLQTLLRLGLTQDQVESSAPLVSTKSISLLMKDLFESEPVALLIVAALIEAQELDANAMTEFKIALNQHYEIPVDALDPYFLHQEIDVKLGHSRLLEDHINWLDELDSASLERILDGVHDIKHAFETQSYEIKRYYGSGNGEYFPRQPMKLAAVF